MPLDTSTYSLALLRTDGRRWNELRRMHAQISTQAAADGSSYLEMGNTKIMCTVAGPAEIRRMAGSSGGGGSGDDGKANIVTEVTVAGFSGTDRRKRSRMDKRTSEIQQTISNAFSSTLFTHIYPRSTIAITLHVLAFDGALLAACLNAAALALVDAGVPAPDYLCACTAGSTAAYAAGGDDAEADPLLDLNAGEEAELPFLTAATLGASDRVSVLVMESRVQAARVEGMLAVAVDGCKQVREILDEVVRRHGKKLLSSAAG